MSITRKINDVIKLREKIKELQSHEQLLLSKISNTKVKRVAKKRVMGNLHRKRIARALRRSWEIKRGGVVIKQGVKNGQTN